ncbi:hypothetical protein [Thalassospira sp.]|uniref:hypothetical protein n=1 Tax=Thalassospira sp. TaxID=1912094 RepID=UPI00257D8DB5|nr:hypothetical protein [Thalassospira sp.]
MITKEKRIFESGKRIDANPSHQSPEIPLPGSGDSGKSPLKARKPLGTSTLNGVSPVKHRPKARELHASVENIRTLSPILGIKVDHKRK